MKVHYGFDNLGEIKNPVVTTGSFDGVHVGHKVIIDRLNVIAKKINGESVLITFHPHPRKALYPDTAGKDLLFIKSQKEKILLLSHAGLDHLIIVNFTIEFSKITSIDFIRKILVGKLNAKCVIVGFNHNFGYNREGNYEYLYELGKFYDFEVEEIPEQDIQNETVSSTKIRNAIQHGNIQRANAYLDHIYNIVGQLKQLDNPFESIELLTYQLAIEEEEKLIPANGIYAVKAKFRDEFYKGIVIKTDAISSNNSDERYVNVHFFDFNEDMLNNEIELLFYKQISTIISSGLTGQFKKQIQNDITQTEELIY